MIEILDRFGHLDGRGWNLKRWYESHISPIRFCMTGNQLHLQMHINCVGNHKMQVCQSLYKFLKTSLFSMELKLYLVFFLSTEWEENPDWGPPSIQGWGESACLVQLKEGWTHPTNKIERNIQSILFSFSF